MRHTIRTVVMTTAAVFALTVAHAAAEEENLVANGEFEKGLDGWKLSDVTGTIRADVDAKVHSEGKAAAHVVKAPAKKPMADWLQTPLKSVPAGKKVVVSAKVKGKGLENCWLKFFVYDAKGESVVEETDVGRFLGTFDWQDASQEFELPKEAVRAELRLCMFKGGEVWLDEVRVADAASVAEEAKGPEEKRKPLEPELVKWLDANAVKLKTLDVNAPFDDLAPLKETLKDARIVQLGENSHGDGACFEAKARLVRFLHEEMGFEVLAFESGLFECDRANELLRAGDAKGAMTGSVFPIWHVAPVKKLFAYMAENSKTGRPLVLAGFDCRRSGELARGFLDALAAFMEPAGRPSDADVAALKRLEMLMIGADDHYAPAEKDLKAGMDAFDRLRKSLDDGRAKLVAKHGEAEVSFFSRCLDNWRDDDVFERSKSDGSLPRWGSGNLRDVPMAANLKWLAEVSHPGKKIVTWGATYHLAHGLTAISTDRGSKEYEGCLNMGSGVHEAFGKSCYTVGFAAYGGQFGILGARNKMPVPKDGSVEDLLHRYGAPYLFVDLRREGPFAKPMLMSPLAYDRSESAKWPDVLDAVLFIDKMTNAR